MLRQGGSKPFCSFHSSVINRGAGYSVKYLRWRVFDTLRLVPFCRQDTIIERGNIAVSNTHHHTHQIVEAFPFRHLSIDMQAVLYGGVLQFAHPYMNLLHRPSGVVGKYFLCQSKIRCELCFIGEIKNPAGQLTKLCRADLLVLLSDIDGLYTADPRKDPDAKPIEEIGYVEVIDRGLTVMDNSALTLCMDNHIPILVFGLKGEKNIMRVACGEKIGTIVR